MHPGAYRAYWAWMVSGDVWDRYNIPVLSGIATATKSELHEYAMQMACKHLDDWLDTIKAELNARIGNGEVTN